MQSSGDAIGKAAKDNAEDSSQGQCLLYVRRAIQ